MGIWDAASDEAERQTSATIRRALELGYNYYETAPGHGAGRSKEMVGRVLAGHRDEVVIATKVSDGQWAPNAFRRSVEASLRRLRTGVIQFHDG